MSSLIQLKKITKIVADTADYNALKELDLTEVTTNPSIIFQASQLPEYEKLLLKATDLTAKQNGTVEDAMDWLFVLFGEEILKIVSGKVHIQVDPRLAFDTEKNVARACKLIQLFATRGIGKEHVVIKLPATWEGIQAAKILESNGIHCNMTTMFNMVQAATSAKAKVSYIAPFVGRIGLWYQEYEQGKHPGVKFLKDAQGYMEKFRFRTKIMAAYFTNTHDIKATAGSNYATLPLSLIYDLSKENECVINKMYKDVSISNISEINVDEDEFRWRMNEDEMATTLLAEVIRNFTNDYIKLQTRIKDLLESRM